MGSSLRALLPSSRLPVLIVGGGLGGFTAALSLHRAGIQNNLIMRESKFTQQARSGAFIGGSAIRILDRLGLGSQYRSLGTPLLQIEIEDLKGRALFALDLGSLGTEVWNVPRANLQHLLLESIPADSVHFNTKFKSLRVSDEAVHVKVQQSSTERESESRVSEESFGTNFVIGADGHNSAVRSYVARPATSVLSGTCVWRAVVQSQDLKKFPFHVVKEVWERDRRFGYARMNPDEVVWWAVISNVEDVVLRPFTPRLLREFADFPEKMNELISAVSSDRDIYRTEMKRVWAERIPWVDHASSKIALVGDAGRPTHFGNFHSGHTFAIEDGYYLSHYLAEQKEKGMLEAGPRLRGYEESREEQMASAMHYWHRFNRLARSKSAVGSYIARRLLYWSLENVGVNGATPKIPISTS